MKDYDVTIHMNTSITKRVSANTNTEAMQKATTDIDSDELIDEAIDNMQEVDCYDSYNSSRSAKEVKPPLSTNQSILMILENGAFDSRENVKSLLRGLTREVLLELYEVSCCPPDPDMSDEDMIQDISGQY